MLRIFCAALFSFRCRQFKFVTMYHHHLGLVLVSLLSCFLISAVRSEQTVLIGHRPQTFLQSSIFGQKQFDTTQILGDPVSLPPSYQIREFDDVDNQEFSGLGTFAHLDYTNCFDPENGGTFDIGIVGHPFDLGVTYRPGARFGPNGARQGARRISPPAGWR